MLSGEARGMALGCSGGPVPGQIADATGRVIRDTGDDVAQIGFRIEAVALGGFDDRVDRCGIGAAAIRPTEQIILPAQSLSTRPALHNMLRS
jgi:hypothetical protein